MKLQNDINIHAISFSTTIILMRNLPEIKINKQEKYGFLFHIEDFTIRCGKMHIADFAERTTIS